METEGEYSLVVEAAAANKPPPFLVGFPPGCNPALHDDPMAFRVMQNAPERRVQQRVVIGENSRVELKGSNFSKETVATKQSKYALCVVDPETREARIISVPQIIPLQYHVKTEQEVEAQAKMNFAQTDAELTQAFGSKQRRQQKEKQVAYGIKDKKIDTVVAAASVPELVASKQSEFTQELDRVAVIMADIPPHNTNAERPEDAYPLDQLVPPAILEQVPLGRILQLTAAEVGKLPASLFPRFVASRVPRLAAIDDEAARARAARLLIFYTYLWRFLQCSPRAMADVRPAARFPRWADGTGRDGTGRDGTGRDGTVVWMDGWPGCSLGVVFPGWCATGGVEQRATLATTVKVPEPVLNYLIQQYTDAQYKGDKLTAVMTHALRSKLQLVLIAVALHIDQFRLTLEELAAELDMHHTAAIPFVKALGCIVESAKRRKRARPAAEGDEKKPKDEDEDEKVDAPVTQTVVRLKVPLVFPQMSLKKKQ
ncbi:putative DNA-directed RNA polymerase I subunit RPA49 [Paratrimastix pyriformis]|uniref:DNA-directed RNA polymerase I subunit RPA49 n=1 Tax=Paratrimastix pyriformis TaxID=342808 RepID=A0ABQ8UHY2_9EUKA|nr:putative DNA-directed RNA polymerase I subunit RPA49 [Paratrimastix pyriformis]